MILATLAFCPRGKRYLILQVCSLWIQPWKMAQVESGRGISFFAYPARTCRSFQGSQWISACNILKASSLGWAQLDGFCWSRPGLADLTWGLLGLKCFSCNGSSPLRIVFFSRRLAQACSCGSGGRCHKKERSEASWGLLRSGPKLPHHHFCCIPLAKASHEPPHLQGVDNRPHLLIEGTTKTCG